MTERIREEREMSQREDRDAESKRSLSKLDRESSPKKSRRDAKPEIERKSRISYNLDPTDFAVQDQKHRRRLQDALPLGSPLQLESKAGVDAKSTEVNRLSTDLKGETKGSSDPSKLPQSQSYYQHRERDSTRHSGRNLGFRHTVEHKGGNEWNGQSRDRRTGIQDIQKGDERTKETVWRHDRFSELEANVSLPPRKKSPFREKKMEPEAANEGAVIVKDSEKPSHDNRPDSDHTRPEGREGRFARDIGRCERPYRRNRVPPPRGSVDRSDVRRSGRRDSFSNRPGERNQYLSNSSSSTPVEKWAHDKYIEANRSPAKNEEDEIAKVEALLAL